MKRIPAYLPFLALLALCVSACVTRGVSDPNVIVVGIQTGPNNLDPRAGLDDASQKIHELIFDSLMTLDDHMRVTPKLAERLEHPDPLTYVRRRRVHLSKLHRSEGVLAPQGRV